MSNFDNVEDFVSDESFQQWILNQDSEAKLFWEKYLVKNPDKKEVILQAASLIKSIHFRAQHPTKYQESKVWSLINEELSHDHKMTSSKQLKPSYFLKIAASVIFFLGISIWLGTQFLLPSQKVISTNYGEIREIYLPDSSLVTLNGNSTLRIDRNWELNTDRKVWLEGEGYFEVKKKRIQNDNSYLKFTVQTNQLAVEVFGTAFNVSDRDDKAQVVLTEGSIALQIKDEVPIKMKPGERFAIEGVSRIHEATLEDISQWSSYKNKELYFNKLSLKEIASQLKYTYGYQIEFPSEQIAKEKFTARISNKDVELLFSLIARSFHLSYSIEGNYIRFEAY